MHLRWKSLTALTLAILSCILVSYLMLRDIPNANVPSEHSKPYRIEVVLKAKSNPPDFWRIVEQGISLAAEEFSVDYNVTGPAREMDVDHQLALVEEALARRPDALILAAGDYTRLVPVCEKAYGTGIPVIIVDSDVDTGQKNCFVGTDNYELGKKLAGLVDQLITPEERFGVVGHIQTTSTAMERSRGLLENVGGPKERLAEITYCDGLAETAKTQTLEMLEKYPDIRCMVGLNESAALGISTALVECGRAGDVMLVACDSSEQQIQYMENGTIQAFVIQNPFNMGYLSMQAAVGALNGKAVDPVISTDSIIITREDMYRPENQKLLFPFTD